MFLRFSLQNRTSRPAGMALTAGIVFIIAVFFGEGFGGSLGYNSTCNKYLGCTTGFFGFDAFEHLLFGIFAVFAFVWFFEKYPKYSLLQEVRWKNVLILISISLLVFVVWEFFECIHDVFRVEVLSESLTNFRLHLNLLDQPTNLDTMGDLAFGLLGTIIAIFFV